MLDQDLLTAVQYALLEPPNGGLAWTEGLWSHDEVYGYLHLRQQQLLKSTHLLVGIAAIPGVINQARYTLPDDWLATVLVAWETAATGAVRELLPADMHQADLGAPTWEATPDVPIAWSDADLPTRTLQLLPAPAAAGTIHLIYAPIAVRPTGGDDEPLGCPEEWALPVIKYGVLADALGKVGRMQDPARARYAGWRAALGADVTKLLLSGMA